MVMAADDSLVSPVAVAACYDFSSDVGGGTAAYFWRQDDDDDHSHHHCCNRRWVRRTTCSWIDTKMQNTNP